MSHTATPSITDYEVSQSRSVTLLAKDRAFIQKQKFTTLTVNVLDEDDSAPLFSQPAYIAHVEENRPPGEHALTVKATDADAGNNAIVR